MTNRHARACAISFPAVSCGLHEPTPPHGVALVNDQKSTPPPATRKERRAAERAARKGRTPIPSTSHTSGGRTGPSMFMLSLGAVVIALVAVAGLVIASGGFGDDGTVTGTDVPPPAEELRDGRTLVAAGATPPVTVEAYEDPQCPACGTFTERIEPLLIAEHVADGTASYTYRDFPVFGDESYLAAAAMRVAEDMDGKFWEYHQVLFHNQGLAVTRERLADMAELVGLDREAFLERLDDPAYRDAVEADRLMGVELGVNSTPTIFVNGQAFRGVPTWDELDAAIREAAAGGGEATGGDATGGDDAG